MVDLERLAIAHWKLKKWISNKEFSKIMVAENALNQINQFLQSQGIEVIDLTGKPYDSGYSVDIVSDAEDCEIIHDNDFVITDMTKPIILKDGVLKVQGEAKIDHKQNVDLPTIDVLNRSTKNDFVHNKKIESNKGKIGTFYFYLTTTISILLTGILIFLSLSHGENIKDLEIQNTELISSLVKIEKDFQQVVEEYTILSEDLSYYKDLITIRSKFGGSIRLIYHKVEYGETLFNICTNYSIDYYSKINLILSINGINDPNYIEVDQLIILPKEEKND